VAVSVMYVVVMLVCLVTVGYSTERWEKHTVDVDPRAMTLDLSKRRTTGSLGDLDRAHYDPNIVSFSLPRSFVDCKSVV